MGRDKLRFLLGVYLKTAVAVIAAAAAAADTRPKKRYKTRWAGKNFDFHWGIYWETGPPTRCLQSALYYRFAAKLLILSASQLLEKPTLP